MFRFILFFFLLLAQFSLHAQQLHVENYTPANGLLDTRVIKVFQDNRGLIYFLTWEGISIFDGQRFENITAYKGTSIGMVNDMVQGKNDTCHVFTFQSGAFKLINNRLIKDTAFDKIAEINEVYKIDDTHWIITSNSGLFTWNGHDCTPMKTKSSGKSKIIADYAAAKNNWFIYSESGDKKLRLLNLNNNTHEDSLNGKKICGMKQDSRSDIFICTDGKWMQLNNEALLKGRLQLMPLYFSSMIPAGFIINSLYVAGNKLCLQNDRGRYLLLNPETGEQEIYNPEDGLVTGAQDVYADRENNYWFIIFSKQVQKAFATRLARVHANKVQSSYGLVTDENNNIFTLSGSQLFLLRQNEAPQAVQGATAGQNPFHWQGRQWFYKTPTTIQSHRGDVIELGNKITGGTSFANSNRIAFDREGRLIICGNHLFVVEKNLSVHAIQLPYFTDNITVDDLNHYWAFNRGGEITSYSIRNNSIIQNKETFKVSNVSTRFALHWNADTFCIGTRYNGIVWVSIKNGALIELGRINTSNGLSNNFASCLTRKGNNLLYAATEFGLDEIKISGSDTSIQNLSAANKFYVPFSYVEQNNAGEIFARSNDNQLWTVTDPVISKTNFIPAVWFNEISVNGKAADIPENGYGYNENNFRFTVSAPCFINAGSIRYNFLLENENKKWQQHSAENFYSINNLSPGKYTLSVTISYPGKIYPDKQIAYTFTIRPPVWKRWWFISLSVLVTALIFWALVRAYYRRKLAAQKAETEKQQAVEKERNRISRDMHDDLGSGLTKIAILSEVAKKQLSDPLKAREQLEKISGSSRDLVDNLQDIIWVLNPVNDTLDSLASYTREYALKYFEPLEVRVLFNYPDTFSHKKISEEKRRNVFLTIKESLHNIAKHAWCNTVTITIKEHVQAFDVTITDDGKGFDPEKVRLFANGITNMRNRVEQAGGTFLVISEPGKGASMLITMPV